MGGDQRRQIQLLLLNQTQGLFRRRPVVAFIAQLLVGQVTPGDLRPFQR